VTEPLELDKPNGHEVSFKVRVSVSVSVSVSSLLASQIDRAYAQSLINGQRSRIVCHHQRKSK